MDHTPINDAKSLGAAITAHYQHFRQSDTTTIPQNTRFTEIIIDHATQAASIPDFLERLATDPALGPAAALYFNNSIENADCIGAEIARYAQTLLHQQSLDPQLRAYGTFPRNLSRNSFDAPITMTTITPALAAEFLTPRASNRDQSHRQVELMKQAMASYSTDPITLTGDGLHRSTARQKPSSGWRRFLGLD